MASLVSAKRRVHRAFSRLLRPPAVREPVFIVGCGRSGTTTLGQLLAQNECIAYLNEPRDIWAHDPRTDIWSAEAPMRGGRLSLAARDVDRKVAVQIAEEFALELRLQRAERLVEKLPINSFRIEYILGIFPDARFVHLIRNGIHVAHSIARQAALGRWFGQAGYKWRLLVQAAHDRGEGERASLCLDNFSRGLLEWRLSVSSALDSLTRVPAERQLEIQYEDLLAQPHAICQRLGSFLGIAPDRPMAEFAATRLHRPREVAVPDQIPPTALAIAGDLLTSLGYASADRLTK